MTNRMTLDKAYDRDDERLAALLRAVDADVPQPDRALLDTLRQQSTELFLNSSGVGEGATVSAAAGEPPVTNTPDDVPRVDLSTPPSVAVDSALHSSSDVSPVARAPEGLFPSRATRRSRQMSFALRGLAAVAATVV